MKCFAHLLSSRVSEGELLFGPTFHSANLAEMSCVGNMQLLTQATTACCQRGSG
jgi:hypothetical protein